MMEIVRIHTRRELVEMLQSLNLICFVLIFIQYNKDLLFFSFVLKCFYQWLLLKACNYLKNSAQSAIIYLLPVFTFYTIIAITLLSIWIYGPPIPFERSDGYLYGGMIVNFVGEQAASSIMDMLKLNVVLWLLQFLILVLLAAVNNRAKERTDDLTTDQEDQQGPPSRDQRQEAPSVFNNGNLFFARYSWSAMSRRYSPLQLLRADANDQTYVPPNDPSLSSISPVEVIEVHWRDVVSALRS
ncbi:fungal protein [Schizosaccharomyces japonicus yFS275]|uniref:Fungal protein n=1 Tax=Schizosaccharomyces japonicus (strain yFS275 / FY16936) TaxID=402676 RepID=B6JYJ6_SCHJY|nr:fungal protein [Schizosaccharomyces japonicus yFS275]EEB06614.1 fungal protein [Schizosaccharomyces japonicus yFS275]